MNIAWIFAFSVLGLAVGLVLLVGFVTNRHHPKPGPGAIGEDNWSRRYGQVGHKHSPREYGENFLSSPQG